MDKLLVVSTALGGIGLLALGALAHAVEPKPLPLYDLAAKEGQRVCVDGTLVHLRLTQSGTAWFTLSDGHTSLQGWTRLSLPTMPGDRLRVCGVLLRSGGVLEIHPDRPQDVTILERWSEEAVSLDRLAAEPWVFRDQHVVTVGVLERDGAHTFLSQPTSGARMRAVAPPRPPWDQTVRAAGVIEYDPEASLFRFRIDAFQSPEGDWD